MPNRQPHPMADNPLINYAIDFEMAIRQNYIASIIHMQDIYHVRNEDEWNDHCDQDQLYFLAYSACPGLEEQMLHYDQLKGQEWCDIHNRFTEWLDAIWEVEAKVLGFDSTV